MELITSLGARFNRVALVAALVGLVGFALAACDSGSPVNPTPTPTTPATTNGSGSSGPATELAVSLKEWAIGLPQDEVAAGKYKFTVTNEGEFPHNIVIKDGGEVGRTPTFGKADVPQVLEVDLQPGTYNVVCDVPGHAEQGMTMELVVK